MTLRIVHVEDNAHDRELVAEALRADQIDCAIVAVQTREDLERALAERPDLILSDYSMPGFNGDEAQALARRRCPDVPFMFVSGAIGEERAVERLKSGATDYVLKNRLDKLGTAVKRALREADDRRRRAEAETELRRLNAELEARVDERTRALVAANLELQQARAAAERASQEKSTFLSRMSHDLRTPLNAIMGFGQLLQFDSLSPEQAESVDYILRGGEHLLALINEVLDIARIESGHLTLSPEPVAVREVLEHAVALVRPLASKRAITVTTEVLPGVCAFADRQRLSQILLNLLSNAIKYNRRDGTVAVRARTSNEQVDIEVADTGAGIPAEKLTLLFTPFERLGAEREGIEGTGLGLALSKRLAEEMKGTLTVESAVDQGTVFHLLLPRSGAAAAAPPTPRAAMAAADYGGSILYIEDNVSNVLLMERILKIRPGVTLRHAPDGQAGLQMVKDDPPDLVLLDLHLSDLPGEEVFRRIWEDRATRKIPVAVLSADASGPSQRRLLASGAIAYLTKPLDIAKVVRLIDEVMRRPD